MTKPAFKASPGRRDFINEQPWQVADFGGLTVEQIEMGLRLGIRPARLAWLLSCPRCTGNKPHHRGIFDR